jgi:hypothetical protein
MGRGIALAHPAIGCLRLASASASSFEAFGDDVEGDGRFLFFEDVEETGEDAFGLGDVYLYLLFIGAAGDFVVDVAEAGS